MELNEVKKILYKEKPEATLLFIKMGNVYYETRLSNGKSVTFEVPIKDMGEASFYPEMEAKHLIRWIVKSALR